MEGEVKIPKDNKSNRHYYRHREEILEKRRQKKLENPEYVAKMQERERKKQEREALRQEEKEKKKAEKVNKKKEALGLLPVALFSA